MVRRRKTRSATTIPKGDAPIIRVVPLVQTALASATVAVDFARVYTPQLLSEHFPNGFEKCCLIRTDQVGYGASNVPSAPMYLAYSFGILNNYDNLLIVDHDINGGLTSAILHHGADLLYDDRLVGSNNGQARPRGSKMDASIEPLLHHPDFIRIYASNTQTEPILYYNGDIPDAVMDKICTLTFFSEIHKREPLIAHVIKKTYNSAGQDIDVDGYKTQLLYAASFGHFNSDEIEACHEANRLTYDDMALNLELMKSIDAQRAEKDPRWIEFTKRMSKVNAVCAIWVKALTDTDQRGDAAEIAHDALLMLENGDPLIEAALEQWKAQGIKGEKASEVINKVVAIGLACGIDSMVSAYIAGTPLEFIIGSS